MLDVEEYVHPTAPARHYPTSPRDELERRSPIVIDRLLGFLGARQVRATFFRLVLLAEREPDMVRAIAGEGHE